MEKDAQRFQLNPPVDFVFVQLCGAAAKVMVTNKKNIYIFICIFLFFFMFSQAELTFCAGDVITVFGEIDEDGFYYVSTRIM